VHHSRRQFLAMYGFTLSIHRTQELPIRKSLAQEWPSSGKLPCVPEDHMS